MRTALLAVICLLLCAVVYVLHQGAQNGRYQIKAEGALIIDTRTGALYDATGSPRRPDEVSPPISAR